MPGLKKERDERREELVKAAYQVALAEGLEHVTGRKVATRAGLSTGLIFFHFTNREGLLEAVLDKLVDEIFGSMGQPGGPATLLQFLESRIERQKAERREMKLLIDFWVMGVREKAIRTRMQQALERYRSVLLPYAQTFTSSRGADQAAEGLAQVALSCVLGCGLQVVIESGRFDTAKYIDSIRLLLDSSNARGQS